MTEHTPGELLRPKNRDSKTQPFNLANLEETGSDAENLIEEVSLRVIERWQRSQQ
jgi:hypothetical protein